MIPTVFGEKAVLRLLANNAEIDYVESYGMNEANYKKFAHMLDAPNGIIYITGPTGVRQDHHPVYGAGAVVQKQVNISTIEDPVEKNLPKINQVQVNNTAGLTFEGGAACALRQDPDIIMVGETRDSETAAISIRSAITGHLVLSTLHTNNAVASIVRLIDMGMEPYMIANSVVGIIAQRLMRKVCPHCCEEVELTELEQEMTGHQVKRAKRAKGCNRCNYTGYHGRIAVHEIVRIDKAIRDMISRRATMEEITAYAIEQQGMKLLREEGLKLVSQGITTMEEFLKIAYNA